MAGITSRITDENGQVDSPEELKEDIKDGCASMENLVH